MSFTATSELISGCSYFSGSAEFFGQFASAWGAVRCQALKYESRQQYIERDSQSWRDWMEDADWAASMRALPESRSVDVPLYDRLNEAGVDFVRCRAVEFPLSKYMQWEFEVYKFNQSHGERIFCVNELSIPDFRRKFAQHDFMVFDARIAAIHDYDDDGEAVGGWWTSDLDVITELIKLHGFLKSNCQPFDLFYSANEARLGKRHA